MRGAVTADSPSPPLLFRHSWPTWLLQRARRGLILLATRHGLTFDTRPS